MATELLDGTCGKVTWCSLKCRGLAWHLATSLPWLDQRQCLAEEMIETVNIHEVGYFSGELCRRPLRERL
jgi:hypothetical protein